MADAVDWNALKTMAAAGLTPDQIRALDPNSPLNKAYGWAAAFADIPELKSILDQAVAGQWTDDMLTAAVENSDWAKTKRQAQVEYEVNRRLHPADVQAERHTLELQIQDKATQMGMTLTPDRIKTMSGWALKNGYTSDEIDRMVLSEFHFDPQANNGIAQGQAATTLDTLKVQAGAYMVPVSDAALGMWVDAIMRKQQDPASFTEWLRQQAKGMFPMLGSQIDAGMDTRTLLDPYKSVVQQELGVADVDMADPKWLGGLVRTDAKQGTRTLPNLDEWRTYIRTTPSLGWSKTTNAQNMGAQLTDALEREMGAKA